MRPFGGIFNRNAASCNPYAFKQESLRPLCHEWAQRRTNQTWLKVLDTKFKPVSLKQGDGKLNMRHFCGF